MWGPQVHFFQYVRELSTETHPTREGPLLSFRKAQTRKTVKTVDMERIHDTFNMQENSQGFDERQRMECLLCTR